MPAFDPVLFPTDISYGSAGGPEFLTELTELGGGTERGIARRTESKERWNIAYGVKREEDVDALMQFFYARRGRAAGFYFQIPNDRIENQSLGFGDGSTMSFDIPLSRSYVSGRTVSRTRIWFVDHESIEVTVDGVLCSNESGGAFPYSLNTDGSTLTFTDDAPPEGAPILVSFDFAIKARFDTDYLSSRLEDYMAEAVEVPIVEIVDNEYRNQNWSFPRQRWNIAYGVRTDTQLSALRDFFLAREGRARGFLFHDHRDCSGTDEEIGPGDAVNRMFQLWKNYPQDPPAETESYRRKITRPVAGSLSMKVGGIAYTDFTVDTTTGWVTLAGIPGLDVPVQASFEFYVPMRFDTDYLSRSLDDYLAGSIEVPLLEARPGYPIDEEVFPTDISYGSSGGPEFSTEIVEVRG
jgi:uncharacterized protein (TIGR02217 family)